MYFYTRSSCSTLALLVLSASVVVAQSVQPEVPYVPTTDEAVQTMLKLADVKKTDVVYDLGCGDGRIVVAAVENLVRFEVNDLFKADIHEASITVL